MSKEKQGRDAKDGRFVTKEYVKKHPATTVTETIRHPRHRTGRK